MFLNQNVFFDNTGFKHLTQKGRLHRTIPDQIRRLKLLEYVEPVLKDERSIVEYRCLYMNDKTHFWGITSIIKGKSIKVVVRKINNGRLTFFSVMSNQKYPFV